MKQRIRWVLALTAAIVIAATVACRVLTEEKPLPVQTAQAEKHDVFNSVSVSGTVRSEQTVFYLPQQTVRVIEVCTSVGEQVEKGDVLFRLSSADTLSAVPDYSAALSYAAMQNKVTATAPVGAVRAQEAGAVYALPRENEILPAGFPAAMTADDRRFVLEIVIPQGYLDSIRVGQQANVTTSALPNQVLSAYVQSLAPQAALPAFSITGETGVAGVTAVLPLNIPEKCTLRPGLSARARIFTEHHAAAVLVPYEAVTQRGEQEYVFTVEEQRAVMHAVQTGFFLENGCEITSGIEAGSEVILSPPDTLLPGEQVEV